MSNLSFVRHLGDGNTLQYSLSISGENMGYFRTTDISVYVDGVVVPSRIDTSSPHIVILEEAPLDGADVLVRREMPETKPYANFERGNNFGHRQVNNTFVQQLYLTQEILDGFKNEGYYEKQDLNMGGKRLLNIGNSVDGGDAVSREEVELLIQEQLGIVLDEYKESLLQLIKVKSYEVPPFSGTVITLPEPTTNTQVEIDGRVLPPSFFRVSSDKLSVVLNNPVSVSNFVVVKTIVLPSTVVKSGDVMLSDYGLTPEGSELDSYNLGRAILDANYYGKKVVGNKDMSINLTGSEDILVTTSVDFGGAKVNIEWWGGKFIIQNSEWVTYTAGTPPFDNLVGTGVLSSDKVSGWSDVPELNNCYIKINSTNYHYTYREIDITQTEYNVCANRGKLLSTVGDMNTANITNVQALPLNLGKQYFGNCILIIGDKTLGNGFLDVINSSRVKIQGISINSNDIIFSSINPNFIDLFDSAFIEIDDVVFNRPFQANTPDRFAYGIRMEYCYDVRHTNLRGYGEGWGLLGSNSSRNIYYDKCDVNRIDFHKPLVELLQLTDCKIGSWGMLLTTLGDVKIDRCTFINNSTDYFSQRAYIAANDSAGGFANGDLIITNSKFISSDNQLMLLYVNKANGTGGVRYPSAVEKQCWNRIVVENCDFGYGNQTALMAGIEDDNGMRWPSEVILRDCTGDCLISRNLVKSLPRYTITNDESDLLKPHNLFIIIDNVETVHDQPLYIGDRRDQNFKIKLNINNLRATNNPTNSGVTLSLVFGGDVSITNSLLEGFNFKETNVHYKPLNVMVDTSTINYTGRLYNEMFKDPAPRSAITASNCVFIGELSKVTGSARIKTVGCKMKVSSSPNFYDSVTVTDTSPVTINNGASSFKNTNTSVNWGQDVDIVISVGSSTSYRVRVNLADENISKTIPINGGYINVLRAGGNVQISNNVGAGTNVYFYYVSKIL